jgi:DNA-binding NarL/FixJ family response regulator
MNLARSAPTLLTSLPARSSVYESEIDIRSIPVIRILIVDDNPAVRRYLRAILEQQESWKVCGEARTGAEALHQVLEATPDLVVLDYQMPDLNGVDVARQIAEMVPKLPILMVTLHLSTQLSEAAREAGVRGACAKQDIGSVVEAVDLLLHDKTYFPMNSAAPSA